MADISSRLYRCHVGHARLSPRKHKFGYGVYMIYLDLSELASLSKKLALFSVERFNLFAFYERDHLKGYGQGSLTERFKQYLLEQNINCDVAGVRLLTYPRVLGYVFNPVSFYFAINAGGAVTAAVAEVSNTFGEMKVFPLKSQSDGTFRLTAVKEFYVSPYGKLQDLFDFVVPVPGEKFKITIDTLDGTTKDKILLSTVVGQSLLLSDHNLIMLFMQYPLVTLKVIFMIHWQALLLFIKRVPHFKKQEQMRLQTGIINKQQDKAQIR